jgi:hypothetical protein
VDEIIYTGKSGINTLNDDEYQKYLLNLISDLNLRAITSKNARKRIKENFD